MMADGAGRLQTTLTLAPLALASLTILFLIWGVVDSQRAHERLVLELGSQATLLVEERMNSRLQQAHAALLQLERQWAAEPAADADTWAALSADILALAPAVERVERLAPSGRRLATTRGAASSGSGLRSPGSKTALPFVVGALAPEGHFTAIVPAANQQEQIIARINIAGLATNDDGSVPAFAVSEGESMRYRSPGTRRHPAGEFTLAFSNRVWTVQVDVEPPSAGMVVPVNSSVGWLVTASVLLVAGVWFSRTASVVGARNAATDEVTIFQGAAEALILLDDEGRVIDVNAAFTRLTGFSRPEAIGKGLARFCEPEAEGEAIAERVVHQAGCWRGEISGRRQSGDTFPAVLSLTPLTGRAQFVGVITDLSEVKQCEARLETLAYYDALTALPNRVLFLDRLQQAFAHARRGGTLVGLLFLDLDGFKQINDTYGHQAGDALLKQVARRLEICVRESDTVARLAGDEFTVILQDVAERDSLAAVAEGFLDAFAQPFEVEGVPVIVNTSLGVALYPQDADDLDGLIKAADQAMYQAKKKGPNNYRFYSLAMAQKAAQQFADEAQLDEAVAALERGEFRLLFQPQMSLDGKRVRSVEGLLRWIHPLHGAIPPGQFIPAAEENGTIVTLGNWALREACRTVSRWRAAVPDLRVSINISHRQFRQSLLLDTVETVLADSGLPPSALELEITEATFMEDVGETLVLLRALDERGIRVTIDDFGSGYAALSYLSRFPIHGLKLAESLVASLPGDADSVAIAGTIVTMAHSLNLEVIAEGVETVSQRNFLAKANCDYLQGNLLSPPLASPQLAAFLAESLDPFRPGLELPHEPR